MQKNKLKSILLLSIAVVGFCGFIWRSPSPGIAYIDNAKLFDSFELKKKLEAEIHKDYQRRKYTMDSLKIEHASFVRHIDSIILLGKPAGELVIKSRQIERYLQEKEKEFERENLSQTNEADQQIWQQLNEYVGRFGQENGYDVVFGVNGSGNIMYGKKGLDKTEEVIHYVNKKYLGKK